MYANTVDWHLIDPKIEDGIKVDEQDFCKIALGSQRGRQTYIPVGQRDKDKLVENGRLTSGYIIWSPETRKPWIIEQRTESEGLLTLFRVMNGPNGLPPSVSGRNVKVVGANTFWDADFGSTLPILEVFAVMFPPTEKSPHGSFLRVERTGGNLRTPFATIRWNGETDNPEVVTEDQLPDELRFRTYLRGVTSFLSLREAFHGKR